MTTATFLSAVALTAAAALAVALLRTRAHLTRVEGRTRDLEEHVRGSVDADVAAARAEARAASRAAQRASVAAGLDEPPRRLPFEPVTGRVVRAVAFGAGARRALARAATPVWSRRGLRRSA
jgi:hypothetical protein